MLYSVDSSIQVQRVLKCAASFRDICQVIDNIEGYNSCIRVEI